MRSLGCKVSSRKLGAGLLVQEGLIGLNGSSRTGKVAEHSLVIQPSTLGTTGNSTCKGCHYFLVSGRHKNLGIAGNCPVPAAFPDLVPGCSTRSCMK